MPLPVNPAGASTRSERKGLAMRLAGWWRPRRMVTALLGVSLSLSLGGCGGGSDEGVSGSSSLASESAASTTQPRQSVQAPGHKRRALSFGRQGITAIVVARDGAGIGVANADGKVRLLDATGARETRLLRAPGGAAAAGLIFSADGRYLVTVGRDSVAQAWSVETGQLRFTLRGHEHALRAVAASADGSVIATGGEETRVMLWDGTTGRLMRVLRGHTDFVNALSVSSDGQMLASGDADARILLWDISTGKLLHTLSGHANEVSALSFSADGRLLASAGEDGKVLLWDTAAGRQVQALEGHGAPVRSLAFNRDGALLAGGAQNGKVVVWDMATRTVSQDFAGSTTAVNAVAFDANSKTSQVFAGNEESHVFSWDVSRAAR